MNKNEKTKNAVINIEQCIDSEHLNSLWYGGTVATITISDYEFRIVANGDIYCFGIVGGAEIRYKDKHNGGLLYDCLRGIVKNDSELTKLINSNDNNNYLTFDDTNWYEVFVAKKDGNEFKNSFILDSEKISDAIIEVLENVKEYVKWLVEEEADNNFEDSDFNSFSFNYSGTTIEIPIKTNKCEN